MSASIRSTHAGIGVTYLSIHALIFASERLEETPISRAGNAVSPVKSPATVTPEPQHRTTVPRHNSAGTRAASFATPVTASWHSRPNGNIAPPIDSIALFACAKQIET